ncbi:DUF4868 domain-containing protein [Halomonas sp. MCCC 1A11062]|nr:DUF4868 domain-containing protein [Halomonas sp. MCCC 1A11062]
MIKDQEASFNKNAVDEVPFDGKYKPEHDEVLVINDYDDIDNLGYAINNPLSIQEIIPDPSVFGTIKALFTGYIDPAGVPVILVQNFDKKRIISNNGLSIFHASNVYKKIEGSGIKIDNKLSAILYGKELKFNSFHLLRQIFDVSDYYKEATDVDIEQFADMDCVLVSSKQQLVSNSDTWVRRKFWLISQSEILQKVPVCDIKAVAAEFNIPLQAQMDQGKEKIKIPEDKKELKALLRFLDEDYYKSPLLQNRYLTNSKIPLV